MTWIMQIDICLLSKKQMQAKSNNLAPIAASTGFRVSKEKTKGMQANNKQWDKIMLSGSRIWVAP